MHSHAARGFRDALLKSVIGVGRHNISSVRLSDHVACIVISVDETVGSFLLSEPFLFFKREFRLQVYTDCLQITQFFSNGVSDRRRYSGRLTLHKVLLPQWRG